MKWQNFIFLATHKSMFFKDFYLEQRNILKTNLTQISKRKQKNRTLFVFYNNESWGTLFFSATTSDLEDNSEGRHAYSPLLVFYSITISRVLKITIECRFIGDFSQSEIDLVLKNMDLCVAKKIKFCHFIYVVFYFLLKYFSLFIFSFPMSLLYHCC